MGKRRISLMVVATQDFGDYDHATSDEHGEIDTQTEKVVEALSGADISIMGLGCHLNGIQVMGIEPY